MSSKNCVHLNIITVALFIASMSDDSVNYIECAMFFLQGKK